MSDRSGIGSVLRAHTRSVTQQDMSMNPLVSVIIPTYNRGQELARTIESALAQTYPAQEIIVVDDGSTDDTANVALAFEARGVGVIRHERNRGVSAAMNTGIRAASGEFIAILEHDDLWLPQKLERQMACFERDEVGLVYCGVAHVGATGRVHTVVPPLRRGRMYRDLLFKPYILTSSSVVLRRECFERAGYFDESLQGPQDYDMWIRVAEHYEIDFVADVLVHFASYAHPHLNRPSRLIPMYHKLNQKFESYTYESALLRRRVRAYRLYTLANMYAITGQMAEARRTSLQSLAQWPANLKCWVTLAAASLGPAASLRLAAYKHRLLRLAGRIYG
jgi:glycosyltransferase involved in cell wall biosynthesis